MSVTGLGGQRSIGTEERIGSANVAAGMATSIKRRSTGCQPRITSATSARRASGGWANSDSSEPRTPEGTERLHMT